MRLDFDMGLNVFRVTVFAQVLRRILPSRRHLYLSDAVTWPTKVARQYLVFQFPFALISDVSIRDIPSRT